MAIRTVVTRGYGNGTFAGTIPLVVVRGYLAGAEAVAVPSGLEYTMPARLMQYRFPPRLMQYVFRSRDL